MVTVRKRMHVDIIWDTNSFKKSLTGGKLVCVISPHKSRNLVMEVLEDPDEDSKPSCNAPNPHRVRTVTVKKFRNKRTEFSL